MATTTVRLDNDVIAYIHEHGKFGESYSDVLRRRLIDFYANGNSLAQSVKVTYQKNDRNRQRRLFGYSICSIIRWMREDGWNKDQVRKVLDSYDLECNDITINCQLSPNREGDVAQLTNEQKKELSGRK